MRYLLAAAVLMAAQPSWALYKCVGAGGTTSFQEQPCERSQAQTTIKPLVEAPKAPAASPETPTPTTARPSIYEQNRQAEAERLRFDAQYKLRDKTAELERHRAACDAQQRAILSNRARANNNLAGAMYEQSVATEAAAAATRCDTRGRELLGELEEARRLCAARGCT
ncbi:DUF4124 domain-containing protein [Variovorax boronicumulans]|uniref:DUF4124 domain-containing protein n=1 Tax=Variovorax boronicumulans TaxID=436515 RepID=UPI0036F3FCE3